MNVEWQPWQAVEIIPGNWRVRRWRADRTGVEDHRTNMRVVWFRSAAPARRRANQLNGAS